MSDEWIPAERTATNPETKERVAFVHDKWVPISASATNPTTGERRVQLREQAGWGSTLAHGVGRGAVRAATLVPLAEGGLLGGTGELLRTAGLPGADTLTGLGDEAFKAYDEGVATAESIKPQGYEGTAQKFVGNAAEMVLPLLMTGGNPVAGVLPQVMTGSTERAKGGQNTYANIAQTTVEGTAGSAGGMLPLTMGPGVTGVAKAAAAQGGVALADVLARLGITSLSDDPVSKKESNVSATDIGEQVGLQTLMGGVLGAGAKGARGVHSKFKDWSADRKAAVAKKEAEDAAARAAAAPQSGFPTRLKATSPVQAPAAPAAPAAAAGPMGAGTEFGDLNIQFGAEPKEPPPPPAAPAPPKETKAQRDARAEEEFVQSVSSGPAGDISGLGAVPAARAPDAPAAAAPEPVSTFPVRVRGRAPDGGSLFYQHPVSGLSDFDRAALAVHSDQHAAPNISRETIIEKARAAGITEEELKAHGEALDTWLTAEHDKLVGAKPGANRHDNLWERPEGAREPIDASKRKPAEPAPAAPKPAPEAPKSTATGPGREDYQPKLSSDEAVAKLNEENAKSEIEKRDEALRSAKEAERAAKGEPLRASPEVEAEHASRVQWVKDQVKRGFMRADEAGKRLKAAAMELAAARRAANNALTATEFGKTMRSLFAELRGSGGLHPDILQEMNLDVKNGREANREHAVLFRNNSTIRSLDGLREWMENQGWIQPHESLHADNMEPGGASGLAYETLMAELAQKGSTVHPQDLDRRMERAALYDWARAHGMDNEDPAVIVRAWRTAEEHQIAAEGSALLDELSNAGTDMDRIMAALGKAGSRAGAVAGLLAASQAARADDGSETDASSTLLVAAGMVAFGGVNAYRNRAQLVKTWRKYASWSSREWLDKLWPNGVKETGAKTIVDKWRGTAAVMTRKVLQGMPHIQAAAAVLKKQGIGGGARVGWEEIAKNQPLMDRLKYIGDLATKANWKGSLGYQVKLNAALEHWDHTDPKTMEVIEAFRNSMDPAEDFPMFHYGAGADGIKEGLRMGMKLREGDVGQLWAGYGINALSSFSRGSMLRDLKGLVLPNGMRAMKHVAEEPHMPNETTKPNFNRYVPIGESWGGVLTELKGWTIHPDLVNDFKLTFHTYKPGMLGSVLGSLSQLSKRFTFESLFHARTLLDGFVGKTIGSIDKGLPAQLGEHHRAVSAALDLYRQGGDVMVDGVSLIDRMLMHGWQIDAKPIDFRVGQDGAQRTLDAATEILDSLIPLPVGKGAGSLTTGMLRRADQQIQRFTWEYMRPGLQIMSALKDFEVLRAQNPGKDLDEIVQAIVDNSHNTFGGQDWRRMGYRFTSEFGRDVAANILSGQGQYWLSVAMVAPDWFVSTAQTWLKALPKVTPRGLKQLPKIDWLTPEKQLAMRYIVGSGIYFYTLGNAWNYMNTGHWMWDNEAPKKKGESPDEHAMANNKWRMGVDRGDGTYVQLNKHFTDFPELMNDPAGGFWNKMGMFPRTVFEMVDNREYMSGKWAPPISYAPRKSVRRAVDYAEHIGGKFEPIPIQQLFSPQGSVERFVMSGVLGMPIRGYTAEEMGKFKAAEKARKEAAK